MEPENQTNANQDRQPLEGASQTRLAAISPDELEQNKRHLEAQLRHAQKMAAVGQLAAGVAHDFKNIMASMLMCLGLLKEDTQLSPEARDALNEMENMAQRANDLTTQLLRFSRREAASIRPIDVNHLLSNFQRMLRYLIGANIKLSYRCHHPGPLWVRANGGMIEQIVLNLCINARDAMPKGGQLSIEVASMVLELQTPRVDSQARSGEFVCISVTDTGTGISPEITGRIFEPFFTTKALGEGTGLGLATVLEIVQQHDGWVDLESQVGVGSTFRVYLPQRLEQQR